MKNLFFLLFIPIAMYGHKADNRAIQALIRQSGWYTKDCYHANINFHSIDTLKIVYEEHGCGSAAEGRRPEYIQFNGDSILIRIYYSSDTLYKISPITLNKEPSISFNVVEYSGIWKYAADKSILTIYSDYSSPQLKYWVQYMDSDDINLVLIH